MAGSRKATRKNRRNLIGGFFDAQSLFPMPPAMAPAKGGKRNTRKDRKNRKASRKDRKNRKASRKNRKNSRKNRKASRKNRKNSRKNRK
jgi:hypothetical protein